MYYPNVLISILSFCLVLNNVLSQRQNRCKRPPANNPGVSSTHYKPRGCGWHNAETIDHKNGGESYFRAGVGEFPWTVIFLDPYTEKHFLTGTLIHPQVVLCDISLNEHRILRSQVFAGLRNLPKADEHLPSQKRSIKKVFSFSPSEKEAKYLSLVILNEPFTLSDRINVICLPPANKAPAYGRTCYASGWQEEDCRNTTEMEVLQLKVIDRSTCQDKHRQRNPKYVVYESLICGETKHESTYCDTTYRGGPLSCPLGSGSNNPFELTALFLNSASSTMNPRPYLNIASVRKQIDKLMSDNGFDTKFYTQN